jgi:hypothetical protein
LAVAPNAVNVDLGVAEALRLVDEILARCGQRRRQLAQDVLDDVEAAEIIVRRLDKLFTDILNEFVSRRVSEDNALLSDLVDETRKYLFGRELLPILDRRRKSDQESRGRYRQRGERVPRPSAPGPSPPTNTSKSRANAPSRPDVGGTIEVTVVTMGWPGRRAARYRAAGAVRPAHGPAAWWGQMDTRAMLRSPWSQNRQTGPLASARTRSTFGPRALRLRQEAGMRIRVAA